MPFPVPTGLSLVALLLAGCGGADGKFPSLAPRPGESPRIIAAPGQGMEAALAPAERAALHADIDRETQALETVRKEMAAAQSELDAALARTGARTAGSAAWSAAQMALSRYDLARSQLVGIAARLTSALRTVDSLPVENPDRQAAESLAAAVERTATSAESAMRAASDKLGG